jgi:hypothetical protein
MRHTPTIAAVLALGALVGACSQQDDPTVAELREDISEQLQEIEGSPALTAAQADCYAELLVEDEADVDELSDVKFSASEPDPEVAEKIAAAAVQAREDCDLADAPR